MSNVNTINHLRAIYYLTEKALSEEHEKYVENLLKMTPVTPEQIVIKANEDFPSHTKYGSTDFYKICQKLYKDMPPAVACLVADKVLDEERDRQAGAYKV
jgi:hypothetical protein